MKITPLLFFPFILILLVSCSAETALDLGDVRFIILAIVIIAAVLGAISYKR